MRAYGAWRALSEVSRGQFNLIEREARVSDTQFQESLDQLLEELAAIEHQRWAHWQRYVHDNGKPQPDGSILLPADLVERWERQINTSYSSLSESEKDSDREQVRKYFPLLERWFQHIRKVSGSDV